MPCILFDIHDPDPTRALPRTRLSTVVHAARYYVQWCTPPAIIYSGARRPLLSTMLMDIITVMV